MPVRENDNTTTPVSTTEPAPKVIEKILGSQEIDQKLTFIVKWVDIEEPQLILAEQLHRTHPQDVISFYEAHLKIY